MKFTSKQTIGLALALSLLAVIGGEGCGGEVSVPAKERRADDVDDRIRAQLSFRYDCLIPSTGFACFSFRNLSSEIISLPGPAVDQQPGKKVYVAIAAEFFFQEGTDWKKVDVGHDEISYDFDVYPGSEVTLLVRVRDVLGDPVGDKVWRIGLGRIYSEPFRYKLEPPKTVESSSSLTRGAKSQPKR